MNMRRSGLRDGACGLSWAAAGYFVDFIAMVFHHQTRPQSQRQRLTDIEYKFAYVRTHIHIYILVFEDVVCVCVSDDDCFSLQEASEPTTERSFGVEPR